MAKGNRCIFHHHHFDLVINSKTHGTHHVLVDVEDDRLVQQYTWHLEKSVIRTSGDVSFYAVSSIRKKCGSKGTLRMHRLILGLDFGDVTQVDHKNHKTLDNRRENLRPCSPSENSRNRGMQGNTSSKYKGVRFDRRYEKWASYICIEGKWTYLGSFKTQKEAAIQYDKAAIATFKEFANLNFPKTDYSKDDFDIEKHKTPAQKIKSSKFVGVSWNRGREKWMSRIGIDGKMVFLGYFEKEESAAKARDDYVIKHKLKRRLNFEADK